MLHGGSNPITFKVGEDLARCCSRNDRLKSLAVQMYRELFEISWAADDRGPTHDTTIKLGITLVGELYRKDTKSLT
jgi:hypothetical protein